MLRAKSGRERSSSLVAGFVRRFGRLANEAMGISCRDIGYLLTSIHVDLVTQKVVPYPYKSSIYTKAWSLPLSSYIRCKYSTRPVPLAHRTLCSILLQSQTADLTLSRRMPPASIPPSLLHHQQQRHPLHHLLHHPHFSRPLPLPLPLTLCSWHDSQSRRIQASTA